MQNKTTMFLINTYKQRHSVCTTKNNRRHEYEQLNTKIQSLKRAYAQMYVLNCNISTMDCHLLKSSYRGNKLNMNAFSLCLLYGRTK